MHKYSGTSAAYNNFAGTRGAQPNAGYGYDINGNPCPPCPPDCPPFPPDNAGGYEDYTGMGPTKLEETDLFARSLNISDQRAVEDEPVRPANFRQKVTRRVEVPFTRKVKVPTRTTKIVPTTVGVKVPVKKLVQVPSYKIVDEEYTVFEEREAVREKEIWVKQIVPEKYMQKVPVKMTRQVKKPTQEIREVEEMVDVQVPSTQAVEVDGYRIDDVEDTKVVEVEEFQEFEYQPHPTGNCELSRTREIGRVPHSRINRNIGTDTFHPEHPNVRAIDLDSNPGVDTSRPYMPDTGRGRPASRSGRMGAEATQADYGKDNFTHTDYIRPAGKSLALTSTNTAAVRAATGGLGVSVKNTSTRHSEGTGVLITKIEHGGRAALAGLLENDIITSVNDMPTQTVDQFAAALRAAGASPLKIYYNRDGRRNTYAIVHR